MVIEWPLCNLYDFFKQFSRPIDAYFQNQNIVSESISNRAAITTALKPNKVLIYRFAMHLFLYRIKILPELQW